MTASVFVRANHARKNAGSGILKMTGAEFGS